LEIQLEQRPDQNHTSRADAVNLEQDIGFVPTKLTDVERAKELPHAVIVSGLRRVGKSTLPAQMAHRLGRDQFTFINFEDDRFGGFQAMVYFSSLYFLKNVLKPSMFPSACDQFLISLMLMRLCMATRTAWVISEMFFLWVCLDGVAAAGSRPVSPAHFRDRAKAPFPTAVSIPFERRTVV
jgi:hypothetical protein